MQPNPFPAPPQAVDPHRSFYLDLLHQWVDVSGHPTPMPFWTTGFIQCKDRYRNQSQVCDVARADWVLSGCCLGAAGVLTGC